MPLNSSRMVRRSLLEAILLDMVLERSTPKRYMTLLRVYSHQQQIWGMQGLVTRLLYYQVAKFLSRVGLKVYIQALTIVQQNCLASSPPNSPAPARRPVTTRPVL